MHSIHNKRLILLKPEDIVLPLSQTRYERDFEELKLLAQSISSVGIIEPLSVRLTGGEYELISGRRRLAAAKISGIRRVPCVLYGVDRTSSLLHSVIENTQRKNLTFFEQARAFDTLIKECKMSRTEVCATTGITAAFLDKKLSLLRFDSKTEARIVSSGLSEKQVLLLLTLPPSKRDEALDTVIKEGMNYIQTEEYIGKLIFGEPEISEKADIPKPEKPKQTEKFIIGDIRLFSNSLSKLLETLKSSGITASLKKTETEAFVEYKIRVKKNTLEERQKAEQLKIC